MPRPELFSWHGEPDGDEAPSLGLAGDAKLAPARELIEALSSEFESLSAENELLKKRCGELLMRRCGEDPSACSPDSSTPLPAHSLKRPISLLVHGPMQKSDETTKLPSEPDLQANPEAREAEPDAEEEEDNNNAGEEYQDHLQAPDDIFENIDSHLFENKCEKLYELTRAFNTLCSRQRTSISSREILQMYAHQHGYGSLEVGKALAGPLLELAPRIERAVKAVNGSLEEVSKKVSMSLSNGDVSKDVFLDTFHAIMSPGATTVRLDLEILDTASEIRAIFVREQACRKIAMATKTRMFEIYPVQNRDHKFMDKALIYLDPFIGLVILINALVICISTDVAQGSNIWMWFEVSFTIIFVAELLFKLVAHGPRTFFGGPDKYWNIFDVTVMAIATCDLVFTLIGTVVSLRNLTTVRLLRFLRLTKLIRVLKLKMFRELAVMVSGIISGLRTLMWAIIFLTFLLFGLGVFLAQVIGHRDTPFSDMCVSQDGDCLRSAEHLETFKEALFGNVFRSMFTTFRCFTDGCSSIDGTPLVPYFLSTYGGYAIIGYMVVTLFVIFGLFNLIMSIFVETTISNASHGDKCRKAAHYREHIRVAQKLQQLIILLCTEDDEDTPNGRRRSSSKFNQMLHNAFGTRSGDANAWMGDRNITNLSLHVSHEDFQRVLEKPEVENLMDDLDISVASRHALFDILDANSNGTLEVSEMVQGMLRLRSSADKSNIVASLLAIRSMQKTLKQMEGLSVHQGHQIEEMQNAMKECGWMPTQATSPTDKRAMTVDSSWRRDMQKHHTSTSNLLRAATDVSHAKWSTGSSLLTGISTGFSATSSFRQ